MTPQGRCDGYSINERTVTKEEFVAHRRQQIAEEKAELERIKSFGPPVVDETGRLSYKESDLQGHGFCDENGHDITVEEFWKNREFDKQEAELKEIENTQYILFTEEELECVSERIGIESGKHENGIQDAGLVRAEHERARKILKKKREKQLKEAGLIWDRDDIEEEDTVVEKVSITQSKRKVAQVLVSSERKGGK